MAYEEERGEGRDGGPGDRPEPSAVNPWRDIFFRPRATTRWLLAHETPGSALWLWLSFTALFVAALFLALTFYPGTFDRQVTRMQLVLFTPVIFLASWGYFVIQSQLLYLLGRLLGGRCTPGGMRVVNAFTTVIPSVVLGLVRLGLLFAVGRKSTALLVIDNVIMIWTVYISLGGIAAAAEITAWRALVIYLATMAVWFAGVWLAAAVLKGVGGLLPGLL